MEKIRGTNFGNWLVLEKWMKPDLFEPTHTEDETWLSRKMDPDAFEEHIKKHRNSYVNEDDLNLLRSRDLIQFGCLYRISPLETDCPL